MADIRPKDLPVASFVNPATGAIIIDNGAVVERTNATDLVNAAVPLASQSQAEGGTDNATRASPLRVKQYVDTLNIPANLEATTTFSQSASYPAGSVRRKLQRIIDVDDAPYNADPTGVANSYAAFAAAIAALPATGGTIAAKGASYRLDTAPTWGAKNIIWDIGPNTIFTGAGTGFEKFPVMGSNLAQQAVGPWIQSRTMQKASHANGGVSAFNVEMIQPDAYGAGQSVGIYAGNISANPDVGGNNWAINALTYAAGSAGGVFQGIEVDANSDSAAATVIGIQITGDGTADADTALLISRASQKWNLGVFIDKVADGALILPNAGGRGIVVSSPSAQPTAHSDTPISVRQMLNGGEGIFLQRLTDASPTGQFLRAVNAANSQNIFYVSIAGEIFTDDDINIGGTRLSSTGGAAKIGAVGGGTVQSSLNGKLGLGGGALTGQVDFGTVAGDESRMQTTGHIGMGGKTNAANAYVYIGNGTGSLTDLPNGIGVKVKIDTTPIALKSGAHFNINIPATGSMNGQVIGSVSRVDVNDTASTGNAVGLWGDCFVWTPSSRNAWGLNTYTQLGTSIAPIAYGGTAVGAEVGMFSWSTNRNPGGGLHVVSSGNATGLNAFGLMISSVNATFETAILVGSDVATAPLNNFIWYGPKGASNIPTGTPKFQVDKDGYTKAARFHPGALANFIVSGTGTPETVVTAPVGSMYLRTDGGAGTTLYIKESGTGNTGWIAK